MFLARRNDQQKGGSKYIFERGESQRAGEWDNIKRNKIEIDEKFEKAFGKLRRYRYAFVTGNLSVVLIHITQACNNRAISR